MKEPVAIVIALVAIGAAFSMMPTTMADAPCPDGDSNCPSCAADHVGCGGVCGYNSVCCQNDWPGCNCDPGLTVQCDWDGPCEPGWWQAGNGWQCTCNYSTGDCSWFDNCPGQHNSAGQCPTGGGGGGSGGEDPQQCFHQPNNQPEPFDPNAPGPEPPNEVDMGNAYRELYPVDPENGYNYQSCTLG